MRYPITYLQKSYSIDLQSNILYTLLSQEVWIMDIERSRTITLSSDKGGFGIGGLGGFQEFSPEAITYAQGILDNLTKRAVEIGDGNRKADKHHHPRRARTELKAEAFQKGPSPIKIDKGRKSKQKVEIAGKNKDVPKGQKISDHRRERKDRKCQKERDPKTGLKIPDHVLMA